MSRNKEYFLNWAEGLSPNTQIIIQAIFDASVTEEYAYRPCKGLMRLYKTYGKSLFTAACDKAVISNIKTYKNVRNLLEDCIICPKDNTETIISHDNIRGAISYTGSQS